MKIALCSPLSKPEPAFIKSFDDLKSVLGALGHDYQCFHTYGMSGICGVRNKITEEALAWEPDYLFWVDDDMRFDNDIVERLLSHKKEFVCALMFSKNLPFYPTMKKVTGEGGLDFNSYVAYPKDSLFEIAACGFAATLIHRRIFEDIVQKTDLGFNWFSEKQYCGESEDMNFCIRTREHDHKIWCDSSIKTRHIGGEGIGEENWLYQKERLRP